MPYDTLMVCVGAETATFGIPGVGTKNYLHQEVEDALLVQQKVLTKLEEASGMVLRREPEELVKKALSWVVIGGGPTGVERELFVPYALRVFSCFLCLPNSPPSLSPPPPPPPSHG